jgi:hypothetical protein
MRKTFSRAIRPLFPIDELTKRESAAAFTEISVHFKTHISKTQSTRFHSYVACQSALMRDFAHPMTVMKSAQPPLDDAQAACSLP